MTKELLYAIEQICREKGIPRDVLVGAIESALLAVAKKKHPMRNITVRMDGKTCAISLFETKTVVETVADAELEISLKDARAVAPEKAVGDEVELPLDIHDFTRIAAQTAKQVIFQRMREAERDAIYSEFKDKAGQIISGTVMRREKGYYFINVGKTEAVLPIKDTLPTESLKRGDAVRAFIEEIKVTAKGPAIVISRTNPQFVAALFKMEVPEISEGLVVIKDIVREPGERTKIAVFSKNPSIDPVGACVGMKGTRVQSIVRELRGERIDIIPWTDDPRMLVARALSPASIEMVGINEEGKTAMVVVNDQQLSIAIGRKGQNVRLAMKLTGWDIDIMSESDYSRIKKEDAEKAFGGGEPTKRPEEPKAPKSDE